MRHPPTYHHGRILLALIFLGAFLSSVVTSEILNRIWRADAVKAGHAEYHAVTGRWQWRQPNAAR